MLFDAFSGSDIGIDIRYCIDASVFNLRRLQTNTKVKTDIVNEFPFADDCALNATTCKIVLTSSKWLGTILA